MSHQSLSKNQNYSITHHHILNIEDEDNHKEEQKRSNLEEKRINDIRNANINEMIFNGVKTARDTEQIGLVIIANLNGQKEQITQMRSTNESINNQLTKSGRILNRMLNSFKKNNIIIYLILIFIVLVIIISLIIYSQKN